MDIKRVIGIIILAAIIVVIIVAVVGFFRSRQLSQTNLRPSPTSIPNTTPEVILGSPTPQSGVSNQGNFKTQVVNGVTFRAPLNWGLLTCSNSNNFEFDPTNGQDSRVVCDVALKPVTVLVGNSQGCGGESVKLGEVQVQKLRIENQRGIDYRWCFSKDNTQFNVTHRVSAGGSRATSKEDYSGRIEEMIANLSR